MLFVYEMPDLRTVRMTIDIGETAKLSNLGIASCSFFNCLYTSNRIRHGTLINRIIEVGESNYSILPWLTESNLISAQLTVTGFGDIIIFQRQTTPFIKVYSPDGNLKAKLDLERKIVGYLHCVLPKANDNFLLMTSSIAGTRIVELDQTGQVFQEYRLKSGNYSCATDSLNRVIVLSDGNKITYLDEDFRPIYTAGHKLKWNKVFRLQFLPQTEQFVIAGSGHRHEEMERISFFAAVDL